MTITLAAPFTLEGNRKNAIRNSTWAVVFWQGVFILLPVVLLAVVSLISLREEEHAAESELRHKAVQSTESLARAVRSFVDEELPLCMVGKNEWLKAIREQGNRTRIPSRQTLQDDFGVEPPKTSQPLIKLSSVILLWAVDYPGLEGEIKADGQQLIPTEPPIVPVPPRWFEELSPAQRLEWERLRSATSLEEIKRCQRAFLATSPSEDARLAALWRTNTSEQILSDTGRLETESGISFQSLACYGLLSATNANLSDSLLNSLWRVTIENPSFVAPKLFDLAEGLASDNASRQEVHWMRTVWNAQSRASEYLAPIRRWPNLQPWKPQEWSRWTDDGTVLALFKPEKVPRMAYKVFFLPTEVVKTMFDSALQENKFLVPEYASVGITVGGKSLTETPGQKDILGNANTTTATGGLPFEVKLFLTNREQMLSAERRRAKLFAGLVFGAMFAALAGLVAAHRAFHRQLQLYEMKSNFVSSVSHELRAPIASVRLMAENLESGKITEHQKQNEYFGFIVRECRRLSALIENVLDFSRIEQGRKQYEFEPTDLAALTKTTVKLMEPYATEKGVSLELSTDSRIEWTADGRALQQALVNLIDNAVKHSARGQSVTVEAAASESSVQLSVSDHGPGIPEAEHERIFERFYRLGSELRRETQGVGIGLSVVKHIVEAHGGRVIVLSEPGKGSQFTIELPLRRNYSVAKDKK